jgi:hypothetical protein
MKKSIKITFEFDADDADYAIKMIKDELVENFPHVIGDGEIFIDYFEIEDID